MKKLFIVLLSAFFISCASTYQRLPTPRKVEAIYENKKSSEENYVLANEWMVETFNNAESVIQFADKAQGIVKGKYLIATTRHIDLFTGLQEVPFLAIITIRVRDNAVKIEIDPPATGFYTYIESGTELGYTPEMFELDAQQLIWSFENRILSTNKDW